MTNEKLVSEIKSGKKEYIPELWEQVEKFIDMQAGKLLDHYPDYYRILRNDMVNESYFHFLKAIEFYDPDRSGFLTYLNWHLRTAFFNVLNGGKTEKAANDPINSAVSYDLPVKNTEDLTIADMIIDETAEEYYRYLEDEDFWNSVNKLLKNAIHKISSKEMKQVLYCMLEYNCDVRQANKTLGMTHDRYAFEKSIDEIKKYLNFSYVKRAMESIGLEDYMCGWGFRKWKSKLGTSSTEYYALQKLAQERNTAAYRIIKKS